MTGTWRRTALDRLEPTQQEHERIVGAARSLAAAIQQRLADEGWEGTPRVEGSVAKGTYLKGSADADVFVAFPPALPREELEARVLVLGELLEDAVVAYAEHPYVQGTWEQMPAEIVPCYDVDAATKLRSAVDRTPFHTEFVRGHLSEEQRGEVRLFKAFLRAAEAYGAEESVLGFSGYLAELVVLKFGDLDRVLAWAVEGFPHPVTLDGGEGAGFQEPLVVVDPVDPERNVAAAVSRGTLERLREAAAAFRATPDERFFQPPPAAALSLERARSLCKARGTRVLAWAAPVAEDVLDDPLWAQLRRATRLAAEALQREQVPVTGTAVHLEAPDNGASGHRAWGLLEARHGALAEPLVHMGPPSGVEEHARKFRERWAKASDARSPVQEREGRLLVLRAREHETLEAVARPALEEANAGKAVNQAQQAGTLEVYEGDGALQAMPETARAALLDRRRPWER